MHRACGGPVKSITVDVYKRQDRGHAEEGDQPHPEDGAGAAGEDGTGSADDVARADLSGNGGEMCIRDRPSGWEVARGRKTHGLQYGFRIRLPLRREFK